MITIGCGAKSGSGTIVRYSVALASLLDEEQTLSWHSISAMVEFISWGVKGEEYKELLEDIHGLAIIAER
jgi:hypothetical protein